MMVRELITLPPRLAVFTTRAGLHAAAAALAVGFTVTERLVELAVPRPEQPVTQRSSWSIELFDVPAQEPAEPAADAAEPAAEAAAEPAAEVAPADDDEPWDGYARMNAHAVIHRLSGTSAEGAAAVERYERCHGNRKTVLAAAERRLSRPAAAGSPS
jgi:hypothetical protein